VCCGTVNRIISLRKANDREARRSFVTPRWAGCRGTAERRWVRARAATALSQEAFAARYGIPAGSLRDWEQGGRDLPAGRDRAAVSVFFVSLWW